MFYKKRCYRLRPATLLNKRLRHKCLPVNYEKLLRTRFYGTPRGDCFSMSLKRPCIQIIKDQCSSHNKNQSSDLLSKCKANQLTGFYMKGTVVINGLNVMLCAIWYHLHNIKNLKKIHREFLLLVKSFPCNTLIPV